MKKKSVYEEYYRILLKKYYIIKIFNNKLLLTQVDNSSLNVAPHYLIEKLLKFSAEIFIGQYFNFAGSKQ